MLTLWQKTRGYKRQAGALIALIPFVVRVICDLLGVTVPPWFDSAVNNAMELGAVIFGVGWADRFAVNWTEKKE